MSAAIVVLAVALALALVAIAILLIGRAKARAALEHAQSDRAELASRAESEAARAADLNARLSAATEELAALGARLEEQARAHEQRTRDLQAHATRLMEEQESRTNQLHRQYQESFEALAARALKGSTDQLLKLAADRFGAEQKLAQEAVKQSVTPIGETLKRAQEKLEEIEKLRVDHHAALRESLRLAAESTRQLGDRTQDLVNALRKPQVRGRYGEVQLARVAELAGLRAYCDFGEQESARDADGRLKRPDLVVRLPNERKIAVDAKTNIEAYLDAVESDAPDKAEQHLDRFARHVAEQAEKLAKKGYWSDFKDALDFVIMFIPGDQFIDAALQRRPDLLTLAAEQGVILASPSTLIGLFRAIHVGWREKGLTDNAHALFALGKELHERTEKVLRDAAKVGSSIDTAARAYNDFVGSVDARLMPTLRKFEEAGARAEKPLPELKAVEPVVRPIKSLPSRPAPDTSTSHAPTGP